MSTTSTLCQGLQSCLEPLLLEPSVLMHQLAPPKQGLSFPWPHKQTEPENSKICPIDKTFESNSDGEGSFNCWNFMQSVTNSRKTYDEPEKVYVHPLSKRSSSSLSTKSLDMCTESLGCETGSGIDFSTDDFTSEKQSSNVAKQTKTIKKVRQGSSFPPPLTSISGDEGVQVQTHREGGRLVIKAFSLSSGCSYFRAERGNGRLRLSLMKDEERERESENEEEEREEENVEDAQNDGCDEESDEDAEMKGCFVEESVKEDGGKVGCKFSSRCNGDRSSRKRLQSLPCCVAIS